MTTQDVLVTSGILAVLMCIIVVIFTPAIARSRRGSATTGGRASYEKLSFVTLLKVFAVAFIGSWVIVSARSETDANAMMTNMIKTGPDF